MAGLFYEQFHVGQVFQHAIRRTLTEADNVFFSALTHNPAALHLDEEYCREHTEFGTRVVNSAFTLGLMVGASLLPSHFHSSAGTWWQHLQPGHQ